MTTPATPRTTRTNVDDDDESRARDLTTPALWFCRHRGPSAPAALRGRESPQRRRGIRDRVEHVLDEGIATVNVNSNLDEVIAN
jgi:hypothetical protein